MTGAGRAGPDRLISRIREVGRCGVQVWVLSEGAALKGVRGALGSRAGCHVTMNILPPALGSWTLRSLPDLPVGRGARNLLGFLSRSITCHYPLLDDRKGSAPSTALRPPFQSLPKPHSDSLSNSPARPPALILAHASSPFTRESETSKGDVEWPLRNFYGTSTPRVRISLPRTS